MGTQKKKKKAVAILEQMQALIQKDGGEMLIAIVLDRPLADAEAPVDDPEMTKIVLKKQSHLFITQMIKPAGSSDPPLKQHSQ